MEYLITVYAGFWKRFIAYILDSIIISFAMSLILIPVFIIFGLSFIPPEYFRNLNDYSVTGSLVQSYERDYTVAAFFLLILFFGIIGIFSLIVHWLYFALMESSNKQATLGKIIMGIVVTDLYGNRITFGKASGRFFGKILSGLILNIGYIMAAFTEKKQALHDMIAGCLVLNKADLIMQKFQQRDNQEVNNY
jgi:uncharacterized RDD family membrane protein YckC